MVCVSVVIPTFNRADTLDRSIRSVLSQTFRDLEIIVVDDGSTEDVGSVVRSIDDPRVRFFRRGKNGGAAVARNTGIAMAAGRFIAFQDSDDVWLPGKLDLQVSLMEKLPANVGAVTGYKIVCAGDPCSFQSDKVVIAPDRRTAMTLAEDQVGHLLRENRISVQNALFRRECFPGSDWFDICARANEDWEFAVRLAQRWAIYEHPDIVVLAFSSADSLSRSTRRQDIGMVRIMRKNSALRARYPSQFADMLFYLGRHRWGPGKRRSSMRFMVGGILEHPYILHDIVSAKLKRLMHPKLRVAKA